MNILEMILPINTLRKEAIEKAGVTIFSVVFHYDFLNAWIF
jgi:hypothetical protein